MLAVTATKNAAEVIQGYAGLFYGNKDVENLTKQTEANLKNLKAWTELMKGHISELKKAQKELASFEIKTLK